ncbi:MAG TPA: hypothetical protein VGR73_01275 [Bryobacteraceae bacterium]|nr:hypothetical protein [Bryobacteraceae bacterium]
MKPLANVLALTLAPVLVASLAMAQQRPAPLDLRGVYQSIPDRVTLPGGLKNSGSPAAVALLPEAAKKAKATDLRVDPWKMCQPVGPFRMMAKDQTKIELVQVNSMIVMLFEDLSHGMMRTIYLKRGHPAKLEADWLGDSVGRWEGDTLVVDTAGFNNQTWLNDEGAQHSDALHLVERIRPVLAGQYLEYKVTAEDPKTLAKPYSYTRYYKKLDSEIVDDVCQDEE